MAGSNAIQILRGDASTIANSDEILLPGQLLYNLDKHYLTCGNDENTKTNASPVVVREVMGFDEDTNDVITGNMTQKYYIGGVADYLSIYSNSGTLLHSAMQVNICGASGVNINSPMDVNVSGSNGVSVLSNGDIRISANLTGNASMTTYDGNITLKTSNRNDISINSGRTVYINSYSGISTNSTQFTSIHSQTFININAAGIINASGSGIQLNAQNGVQINAQTGDFIARGCTSTQLYGGRVSIIGNGTGQDDLVSIGMAGNSYLNINNSGVNIFSTVNTNIHGVSSVYISSPSTKINSSNINIATGDVAASQPINKITLNSSQILLSATYSPSASIRLDAQGDVIIGGSNGVSISGSAINFNTSQSKVSFMNNDYTVNVPFKMNGNLAMYDELEWNGTDFYAPVIISRSEYMPVTVAKGNNSVTASQPIFRQIGSTSSGDWMYNLIAIPVRTAARKYLIMIFGTVEGGTVINFQMYGIKMNDSNYAVLITGDNQSDESTGYGRVLSKTNTSVEIQCITTSNKTYNDRMSFVVMGYGTYEH